MRFSAGTGVFQLGFFLFRRSISITSAGHSNWKEEEDMAGLFLQISISLDGYIEDAGRDIEWMTSDLSMDRFATETLRSVDGMIFGRRAHELLAKFWPDAGSNNGASEDLIEQARLRSTNYYP
jgi:RibD C-terminal domain